MIDGSVLLKVYKTDTVRAVVALEFRGSGKILSLAIYSVVTSPYLALTMRLTTLIPLLTVLVHGATILPVELSDIPPVDETERALFSLEQKHNPRHEYTSVSGLREMALTYLKYDTPLPLALRKAIRKHDKLKVEFKGLGISKTLLGISG